MLLKKISFCALFTVVSAISSDQQLLNLIPATATMTQVQINNSEVKKISLPGDDYTILKALLEKIVTETESHLISHFLIIENDVAFGLLKSYYEPGSLNCSLRWSTFSSKQKYDRAIKVFFK